MAVGNQATVTSGGLNAQLGDVAISLRDAAFLAQKLWAFVSGLGANQAAQVAALQAAPLNFTAADAQSFWTDANYAFAVSQFYYGTLVTPPQFNYDSALALARGAS